MEELLLELRQLVDPTLAELPTIAGLDSFSLLLGGAVGLLAFVLLSILMGGGKFIIKGALSAILLSVVVYVLSAKVSPEAILKKLPEVELPKSTQVLEQVKEQKALLEQKMAEQKEKLEAITE
tara:strand:- start:158 stop:526 length:369 start_codon:yes stop_codon:yes gene_type:complete